MYKVGIIGCGWIGAGISDKSPLVYKQDNHLRAYCDCPDTELIVVYDKNTSKALDCAARYDILSHRDDYVEMVKEYDLDIVSVCTPPETHCQIVCDIASYVKAILCEKPIALTLEDADRMIDVCHQHGTILQINHQRAFTIPKFRFSRDIIDTGTHMFELLTRLFGKYDGHVDNLWVFGNTTIEIEYVDTSRLPWEESHIFELDTTHNAEPMILDSVKALVECLKTGVSSHCSGEQGREALRLALIFKEQFESLQTPSHS